MKTSSIDGLDNEALTSYEWPTKTRGPVMRVLVAVLELRFAPFYDKQAEFPAFCPLVYWFPKASHKVAPNTGEIPAPSHTPFHVLLAWLYDGIQATSCQGERILTAPSFFWVVKA